jgi:tRNA-splicing ligase RtcB
LGVLEAVKRISDYLWEIPINYKKGMKVPARIYANNKLFRSMDVQVFEQITNVATLPGIQKYAFCMPDAHSGYGFPIGGVAAMDFEQGVISPGGIGFDINCGMRLVLTSLTYNDVKPKLKEFVDTLFSRIPSGVGATGFVRLSRSEFEEVMKLGSRWCIEHGYGWEEDLERTEENGEMEGANPRAVSDRAAQRGLNQLGTLGSGNHYLEIQVVKKENIYDEEAAKKIGIFPEQVTIMYHTGSRGFGHQIGTDYLQIFLNVMERKYGIKILDRELACAPINSTEGQNYFSAMKCAANMSFANRQVILHRIREVMEKVFHQDAEKLGLHMIYDVAHNIAKVERYVIDGEEKTVLVHRKGATRSFGPGRKEIPLVYRELGQPVIIGGSMETGSYLLLGTKKAEIETFGSTAHGSGRTMSRAKAKKLFRGERLQRDMMQRGIYVKTVSFAGLAEEAGAAYKSIDDVVQAVELAGLSKKVVRFIPVGNIKG